MHSPRIPIAMAISIALCAAPLMGSAQTYGSSAASEAQADESAPAASPLPQKSAQPAKSLMGMVMAALIESAEQTARQRRDATRHTTALDEARPSASADALPQSDPASVTSGERALREQVAVQDDPL
jgi:hypothetical protein